MDLIKPEGLFRVVRSSQQMFLDLEKPTTLEEWRKTERRRNLINRDTRTARLLLRARAVEAKGKSFRFLCIMTELLTYFTSMFICYNMLFDKARVNLDVARLSRRRSGHDLLREAFEVTADAGLKLCVTVDKVLQSQLMEDREQEEALDPVSDPMSDVVDGERDGGVMRGRRTAGSSSSGSPGTTSGGEETMYHDGGEEQLRDDDDDYAFQVGPPQVRFKFF